jgi:hypothetical protein
MTSNWPAPCMARDLHISQVGEQVCRARTRSLAGRRVDSRWAPMHDEMVAMRAAVGAEQP